MGELTGASSIAMNGLSADEQAGLPTVVAYGLSADDVRALLGVRPPDWRLHLAQSPAALSLHLQNPATLCLVCDVSACSSEVLDIATGWLARMGGVNLVLRMSLISPSVQRLLELRDSFSMATISIRGFDDLVHDLQRIGQRTAERRADARILQKLAPYIPAAAASAVAGALIVGRRRVAVGTLAELCGVAARTLEWRLRRVNYPRATEVLAWTLCLHTSWRLEVLRWPVKRTAFEAGFSSTTAFRNFVRRRVGYYPTPMQHEGFEHLLDRMVGVLTRRYPSVLRIP